MKRVVVVRFTFEGQHHWPEAPDEVGFLRTLHRHRFFVEAEKEVSHGDREVEFILLQRAMCAHCEKIKQSTTGVNRWSCEHWAEALLVEFGLTSCSVFEDNENGARVMR